MKTATSYRWVITPGLISIFAAVVGATPAYSQSTPAPGSVGSHPGRSQEIPIPAKPRSAPFDIPGQTTVPNERARLLEERLRSGQMERPIAQGEVSDRLEQLHSGSAGRSTGETAPGQSGQGN
jgi:hypothetical protein